MNEIVAAIIGVSALIGIPAAAWFSKRATREGRLLLRIENLGSAHTVMPESPERQTFGRYLTSAIADLNEWLDADNVNRRRRTRRINGWTYGVGVTATLIGGVVVFESTTNPWLMVVFGSAAGTVISIVNLATTYLVERNAGRKASREAAKRTAEEASARLEALRVSLEPNSALPRGP